MSDWQTAWITGASSGIGRELALRLAAQGVRVAASSRSSDRLEELSRQNANIVPFPLDVTNRNEVNTTVAAIQRKLGQIDLAILNAAIHETMNSEDFSAETAARSMAVNYFGIINALDSLIPAMTGRRAGHIALMSSLAGYRGGDNGIAYCPTKAAIISLAECLLTDLLRRGVQMTVINPGMVDTPMVATASGKKVPVGMAAEYIIAGLRKKQYEIAFPLSSLLRCRISRALLGSVYHWRARKRARLGTVSFK
jgi:NAD(P)-dependent dehydrogenase (short-subunit alcohol dehydrogenase family)